MTFLLSFAPYPSEAFMTAPPTSLPERYASSSLLFMTDEHQLEAASIRVHMSLWEQEEGRLLDIIAYSGTSPEVKSRSVEKLRSVQQTLRAEAADLARIEAS